jgi:pyruvate dehydrogenase E1 component alpha subunit
MVSMIAEIYGSEQGCAKGWGGSQHLIDESVGFMGSVPILGASLAIATGAAYWLKATGTSSIVVSFFGDAAVEEGVFHESLNFAALRRLPILYVCENNLYSTHAHIAIRQPDRPLTRLGAAHGVLSLECDGNDYQDIYSTFTRAHREIASTKGPAFIVANTYRHLEHVGPGDDLHLGYRKKEELDFHLAKDPIARIRRDLKGSFADFETREGMLLKQIRSEIEENLVAAKLQVNVATR